MLQLKALTPVSTDKARQGMCHFIILESYAFKDKQVSEEFIRLTGQGCDWILSETRTKAEYVLLDLD